MFAGKEGGKLLFVCTHKRFRELLFPAGVHGGILGTPSAPGEGSSCAPVLLPRSGAAFPHQHVRVSLREGLSIAEKRKGGIEQRLLTFVMFPAASLSPAPRGEGSSCCSRDAAVVTVWGKKTKKQKHFHEARSHSSHGFLHQRGAGGPVPPSPLTPVLPSHPQHFAALQFSL